MACGALMAAWLLSLDVMLVHTASQLGPRRAELDIPGVDHGACSQRSLQIEEPGTDRAQSMGPASL